MTVPQTVATGVIRQRATVALGTLIGPGASPALVPRRAFRAVMPTDLLARDRAPDPRRCGHCRCRSCATDVATRIGSLCLCSKARFAARRWAGAALTLVLVVRAACPA